MGTHQLFVSFTEPGVYSFDSGISLHIFDQCDDSEFPSAPVITPDDGEDYWINDPDLTFSVTWETDTVND